MAAICNDTLSNKNDTGYFEDRGNGNNLFICSLRQLIINYVGPVNVGVSH